MGNYVITLKHVENGLKIEIKDYDGTLEQLHAETGADTVMIYNAARYLPLVCDNEILEHVLVVCDDDGKLKDRPVTLPILGPYLEDGKPIPESGYYAVYDDFVGDLCFIAERPYPYESDDRGLTRKEAKVLEVSLKMFIEQLTRYKYPDVVEVEWFV